VRALGVLIFGDKIRLDELPCLDVCFPIRLDDDDGELAITPGVRVSEE
jgi:hypothetical protein